jgi:hypothetical protein
MRANKQRTRKPRRSMMRLAWGLAIVVSLCLIGGCGDDGSPGKDTSAPTVLDTDPAEGATDVSPYPIVQVWFSEPMDPATIDTLTFYVEGLQAHSIAYDDAEYKATLYPAGLAQASTEYHVHVDSAVADADSHAMGQEMTFAFTTGPLDCEHMRDRFEPNDSMAYARPVEINVQYPGLTSCGAVERTDIYKFTLTEASKVTVVTQAAYIDTERVSWQINYRRADGKYYATLGTSFRPSNTEASYFFSFLPGTYWVEIGNYYAGSHNTVYHLTVETSAPALDDDYEDNDFPDEARPITVGLHEGLRGAHVDADYFSIDLAAGETLTATATMAIATETNRRIEIASVTGWAYVAETQHINPITVSWTAAQAGTYLIMVMWWSDDIVYDLNVEVTP